MNNHHLTQNHQALTSGPHSCSSGCQSLIRKLRLVAIALTATAMLAVSGTSDAALNIGAVCHVKGQAENLIHGMGLVVGLNGTGDGRYRPTTAMLAQMTQQLTNTVDLRNGRMNLDDLKNAKNVAMVMVTAVIPAGGAREGEKLECRVHATGAKSLQGGYLLVTPLITGYQGHKQVYGVAEGAITTSSVATSGRVSGGCQMIVDVMNPFVKNGEITLVLKKSHSGFTMAHEVEQLINEHPDFREENSSARNSIARAIDARNIVVRVAEKYRNNAVEFVAYVKEIQMPQPPQRARVVIRQHEGVIVIDPNVYINKVAITHKNLVIQPDNGGLPYSQFVPFDPTEDVESTRLKSLVDALKALKVPTKDVIDIIKTMDEMGAIYGDLIIN